MSYNSNMDLSDQIIHPYEILRKTINGIKMLDTHYTHCEQKSTQTRESYSGPILTVSQKKSLHIPLVTPSNAGDKSKPLSPLGLKP